jgi:hypothetical protein
MEKEAAQTTEDPLPNTMELFSPSKVRARVVSVRSPPASHSHAGIENSAAWLRLAGVELREDGYGLAACCMLLVGLVHAPSPTSNDFFQGGVA